MLFIYLSTVFPLSLQQNGSSLKAVLNLSYLLFTHQCPVQCLTNTFHEWMNCSSTVSKSSLNPPSIANDDNSLDMLIRCYHHSLSQPDTLWVLTLFQWLHTLSYLFILYTSEKNCYLHFIDAQTDSENLSDLPKVTRLINLGCKTRSHGFSYSVSFSLYCSYLSLLLAGKGPLLLSHFSRVWLCATP